MTRLEDLQGMRDGLLARIATCQSDQNYAVLTRTLLDVLAQIEQIDPQPVSRKETALDEFSKRLLDRRRAGSAGVGGATAN